MPRITLPGRFAAALAAAFVAGCAQPPTLDSAQSTPENFSKAKAAGIRPVAVADFRSTGGVRSAEALHLKDTLAVELQGAGLFDSASQAVIEGELVSTEIGKTHGYVRARFIVTTGGRVVYDRELSATSTWPTDANVKYQQGAIYSKLVGLLLTDPGFCKAVPR